MGTIRQKITELLKVKPVDTGYLSRALGVTQRAIEHHLEHVAKSVGKKFEITASICNDCGFTYKDRSRTTKPTKCPKCRSESIMPPLFFVREDP